MSTRIKFSATDNTKGHVANDLHYLLKTANMVSREVTKKDILGRLTTNEVWSPNDGSTHSRIGDKWFCKYYDHAHYYVKKQS